MAVIEVSPGEEPPDIDGDVEIVHSHSVGRTNYLVTLDKDPDEEEEGNEYGCPVSNCGFVAEYDEEDGEREYDYSYNKDTDEYECGECDTTKEDEKNMKIHYTSVHGGD